MDLVIKLILVEGSYKALVIDELRDGDRLVFLSESDDQDVAYNAALDFVTMANRQGNVLWH